MALQIIRNNIINVEADAIVNTANPKVGVGRGVDCSIYEAAGWDNCMARMMSLDRDFTIPGLKFTGAAGPRGDGFSESLLTGNIVGKMVLGEMMAKEGK